jgi:hypothetical protein
MEGLVKEANALLKEDMAREVMDAAIIAAAQKVEHYEISSYGTARAYALQLQMDEVADLLEQTLKEEYDADDTLSALALSQVNLKAAPETTEPLYPAEAAQKPAKKTAKAAPKKAAPKKTAKKAKAASPKRASSPPKSKKAKRK